MAFNLTLTLTHKEKTMKTLLNLSNGERLKIFRKLAGMDQYQLAEATKIQQSAIHRLETGRYKMTVSYAVDLAKVLGCDVPDIYTETQVWAIDAEKIKALPIMQKYTVREISGITGVPMESVFEKGVVKFDRNTVEKLALLLCGGKVELILAA